MRALSLTQPWATLVAIGAKQIETRSWRTRYRGPLAIHAAKGLAPLGGNRGLNALVAQEPFWSTLMAAGCTFGRRAPTGLPFGAIVAVCNLVGCEGTNPDEWPGPGRYVYGNRSNPDLRFDLDWPIGEPERSFGDYTPGRHMWLLSNIRALPIPVPCGGKQGLWNLDARMLAAMEGQL